MSSSQRTDKILLPGAYPVGREGRHPRGASSLHTNVFVALQPNLTRQEGEMESRMLRVHLGVMESRQTRVHLLRLVESR